MADTGLDPLPVYEPAPESLADDPDLVARYPLALLAGKSALRFLNSSYSGISRHAAAEGEPLLDMSADDAAVRAIRDGDLVRVFNDRGEVTVRVRITDAVRPRVVSMPFGWWRSEVRNGQSANALTSDGVGPLGRGADFLDTLVEVARPRRVMRSARQSSRMASVDLQPWDVVARAIRPPLQLALRPSVAGTGHVPGAGGAILAANHLSYVDIFLLAATSPRTPRFVGKSELNRGTLGRLVTTLGMVAVDRGRGDVTVVHRVAELLRDGAVVGIFPEGTRSPDGRLYQFRSGVARAAAQARVPTIPVTISGTRDVWPKGGRPALRRAPAGSIAITYHEPLAPPANTGRARRAFTQELLEAIAAGCDQPLADCFAPELPAGVVASPPRVNGGTQPPPGAAADDEAAVG